MPVLKSGKQVNKLKNCTHILNLLPSQRARLVEERISDCTVFFFFLIIYVEQRRNYRLVSCVLLMHSAGNSCDKIITSVSNPNCIPCLSFVQLLSNWIVINVFRKMVSSEFNFLSPLSISQLLEVQKHHNNYSSLTTISVKASQAFNLKTFGLLAHRCSPYLPWNQHLWSRKICWQETNKKLFFFLGKATVLVYLFCLFTAG